MFDIFWYRIYKFAILSVNKITTYLTGKNVIQRSISTLNDRTRSYKTYLITSYR